MENMFKTTGKNMKRWMKTIEKPMQLMETTMNTHGKKTMKISEKSMKTLEKSRDSANERF